MLGLIVGWIVLASFSRVAITKAMAGDLGIEAASGTRAVRLVMFLNFLRVTVTAVAMATVAAAIVLASALSTSVHISVAAVSFFAGAIWFVAWMAWCLLNWLLSFMAVLAPAEQGAAFSSAGRLLRTKKGGLFTIGLIFGTCHFSALVLAWGAVSTVFGFAGALPVRVVFALEALVVIAYCAAADFFYTGRMAAYVALLRPEETMVESVASAPPLAPGGTAIDKNEVILSDIPPLPA